MGAIRYSSPIWLVPTYILPAKEDTFFGKFQPDSLKTERLVCVETDGQTDLVCVETDGQTDMTRSTCLVMLFKNTYSFFLRIRLHHCVANF